MPTIKQLRDALPPFRNQKILINQRQGTKDIINEILEAHEVFAPDYDRIYKFFDSGNVYNTCGKLFNFLKYNLRYNEEYEEEQSSKSPSGILDTREGVDCKHYSLFEGGVLDAIKRNEGDNWTWCYRFATDKIKSAQKKEATHVFVVVFDGNREIWVDPCMLTLDYRQHWYYYEDHQPMSLVRISGASVLGSPSITVNKDVAWINFLTAIQLNSFGIKDIILSNSDVTFTDLKGYCLANGFDFNQLLRFLNA